MGEQQRAITYNQVQKAAGNDNAGSQEMWRKIGDITGAGHVPLDADGNASIDLTETSDAKRAQIDRLLAKEEEQTAEEKAEAKAVEENKKRGNK